MVNSYFECDSGVLYKGDCLDVLPLLHEQHITVDAVITDPPYGITQCKWDNAIPFDKMWEKLNCITKPTTPICLFGCEPFSSMLRCSNLKYFKYDWIWDKVKGTGFLNANKQPMRCYEIISVFYKKQCLYKPQKTTGHICKKSFKKNVQQSDVYGKMSNDNLYHSTERFPRNIQVFSVDTNKSALHPTQKPVALLEYLIKTYTNEGDTVLDFTIGSGTTAIAAINTNRKFIGIELNETYCEITKNRIQEAIYK